jgi:L-cysteine desulfidase
MTRPINPYPSCSSVGVKSSAADQDRTGSKCVSAHVVKSRRIIKNPRGVNVPRTHEFGATPAMGSA